jgi:two-component system chemotaxis sensor kinase CheA
MATIFDDPEMVEIFEGFLVESNELLDNISQDLMIIESEPENFDLINQLFRAFHTIKGTSSFMGFEEVTSITHHAEDILNKLRKNELTITQEIIDVLLNVHDWIRILIDKINNRDDSPTDYSETVSVLLRLKDGKNTPLSTAPKPAGESGGSSLEKVLNSKELISGSDDFNEDELALIQAAFLEVNAAMREEITTSIPPATQESAPADGAIVVPVQKPESDDSMHSDPSPATGKSAPDSKDTQNPKAQTETIRIEVNRIETMMNLSGELVLARNRLAQMTKYLEHEITNKTRRTELEETTAQIDFVTSEIQAAIMRMRMVQIGKLYQKAPRIVRDLSKEFSKKINLIVKGEDTEIDRGIIEELNDPLVHMIRNSCDHGIEAPDVRIAKGKSPDGTITLDADQEGNNIVLRISDDGAGMDPDKLKNKAIEKGLITPEQAHQMTKEEAFQIIFMPGFSTAVKISNTSGRGVGMDVVRTNIVKLKGSIEIQSEIGVGSTFKIKLPLTLAIIQGLLVQVQDETYAIPLSSVEEVVAVEPGLVKTINQREVISIRNQVHPILRLDEVVKLKNPDRSLTSKYVVINAVGINRVGLVVDKLLGQQEIVIKSIGEYFGDVKGIAGSTILGDGRAIMILDVNEIVNLMHNKN